MSRQNRIKIKFLGKDYIIKLIISKSIKIVSGNYG